jgi:hypothetical protein
VVELRTAGDAFEPGVPAIAGVAVGSPRCRVGGRAGFRVSGLSSLGLIDSGRRVGLARATGRGWRHIPLSVVCDGPIESGEPVALVGGTMSDLLKAELVKKNALCRDQLFAQVGAV